MRHARGLITTAEAIQQVFHVPVKLSCRPGPCPRSLSGLQTTCLYPRGFSTTNFRSATYKPFTESPEPVPRRHQIDLSHFAHKSNAAQAESPEPVPRRRQIDLSQFAAKSNAAQGPVRDEAIEHPYVLTRLADGKLSEVRTLRSVLSERMKDEKGKFTQTVRVVAEADPSQDRLYPIVGFYGIKELKEKENAAKKKEKEGATKEKNIEFTWGIGDHDLSHRMQKVQSFLQKGKRIEIRFGSPGWRKIKRVVSDDEARSLLGKIREAALQVDGAQVMHEFKGKLLKDGFITFQGPSNANQRKKEDVDGNEESHKKAEASVE